MVVLHGAGERKMMDDLDNFLDWVERNFGVIMFAFGVVIGFFVGKIL